MMIEITTTEYSALVHAHEKLKIIETAQKNMTRYQFVDFLDALFLKESEVKTDAE